MASFKKQWKLEELNENWKGYEEYIFNDRDMVSLVKNYFINASISEELRTDLTDSLTPLWKEAFEATTVMTSGAYDVQVTDDGESFYVLPHRKPLSKREPPLPHLV